MPRTDSTLPGILIQENDSNGDITLGQSNGSPSSTATLASTFAVGCLLSDTTSGKVYQNVGTLAAPSWNAIGDIIPSEITLASAAIMVGNASGVGAAVTMSGDATISNTGVVTIANNAVTSAKTARTFLQNVTVSLSSAQLLALRATPIEIIPAVAGTIPVIESFYAIYDAGGVVYTITAAGDDLALRLNNASGDIISSTIETTGLIDQATDQVESGSVLAAVISSGANANGASIVAHNIGANEWTAGTGVVRLNVSYRYITSSL